MLSNNIAVLVKINKFYVDNREVQGELSLLPGRLTLLRGENGVGKSSLVLYLKLNQRQVFSKLVPRFIDQVRLSPLNDVSFEQILGQLSTDKAQDQTLFTKWEFLVKEFRHKPIKSLSGGQNQMVKILISLYLGGDIFIFDEPLQYLDGTNKSKIVMLLEDLKSTGKGVLLIEHNDELVKAIVDTTVNLSFSGKLEVV